jgi:hypothetical protein
MKENLLTDTSTNLSRAASDALPLHARDVTGRAKFSRSCLKSAGLHNMTQRVRAKKASDFLS